MSQGNVGPQVLLGDSQMRTLPALVHILASESWIWGTVLSLCASVCTCCVRVCVRVHVCEALYKKTSWPPMAMPP